MQKIISWYMEHKTYGNILIIGIIGLMLYNIGYGVGTAIYRIFWLISNCVVMHKSNGIKFYV